MPYPYESRYLESFFWKDIDDQEILNIVNEIQEWLIQFVQVNEQYNYEWGKPTHTIYPPTAGRYGTGLHYKRIELPETIYFKHEADFIVFKLRWD